VANQQPNAPANQQDQAAAHPQDRVVGERRFSSSSTDVTAERECLLTNLDQQDQAATDQQDDTATLHRFPSSSTGITAEKESLLAKQNQDPSKPDEDEFADLLTELTLVTAYANFMNNTPIINAMHCFVSRFLLSRLVDQCQSNNLQRRVPYQRFHASQFRRPSIRHLWNNGHIHKQFQHFFGNTTR